MQDFLAFLQSAVVWFVALMGLSAMCSVTGVYLLFGLGWALITCGVCFFGLAWFLWIGIAHG